MADDNISSKQGIGYGLDENINPLNATNLFPSNVEKNQNKIFIESRTELVLQKCTDFKEQSPIFNVNETTKLLDIKKTTIKACDTHLNRLNRLSPTSKFTVEKDRHSLSALDTTSTQFLLHTDLEGDGLVKEYNSATFSDSRRAEILYDSFKKPKFSTSDIKQTSTSNNLFENHSEAGPDVAEFTEDEFRSVAELFKEPSAFDFFQKASNSKLLRESPLGRLSQFVKVDSTYKCIAENLQEKSAQDSGLDISGDSISLNVACGNDTDCEGGVSSTVMTTHTLATNFEAHASMNINTSSMKKMEKTNSSLQQSSQSGQEHKMFTEEEFTQALKMQELLFHEKQLKRDKERVDQVKIAEREKQMLKNQIVALNKSYRASRGVLEELLNVFTLWLTTKEQERLEMGGTHQKAIKDRDQALEDLQNVETAFADLHRRYENCKSVLEGYKQNEDRIKHQVSEMQVKLKQQEQMYDMLRSRIQDKLDSANAEIESAKKSGDAEVTVLRAQLKKAEMKISSLEKDLEQKSRENVELSSICDDLIAKVGKT